MKKSIIVEVALDKIVGGGQALGTLPDGRKLFVWGGLPGEKVRARLTKKKSSYAEGIVTEVLEPSSERILPLDETSFLSTSPWQIMGFKAEQRYKASLIHEAFALHGITLPEATRVFSDGNQFHYRNKVEFSWFGDVDTASGTETLDLAFFRRGSSGKIIINECSLLPPEMMQLATTVRDQLRTLGVSARQLKTLLIRCDANKNCVWQLYVKDRDFDYKKLLEHLAEYEDSTFMGGEVIYSEPKSPASVITERLASTGSITLNDSLLAIQFRYATEGFFQINLPVYEQALKDMSEWITDNTPVLDLYSGVGTIGLTIGGEGVVQVEVNEHAVREMERNIKELGAHATPVLAASEQALEYITSNRIIVVDPPRAGLHKDVIEKLLAVKPPRIIYLSCNPVTQARDAALLLEHYDIKAHRGYNFFPRTPHIEHLVVCDLKP